MSYDLSALKEEGVIHLTVTGELDKISAADYIVKAFKLGNNLGFNNYLFDLSKARNTDSNVSNFKYVFNELLKSIGFDIEAKIAVIVTLADYSHDYLQTIAIQENFDLEIFTNTEKAKDFLLHKN